MTEINRQPSGLSDFLQVQAGGQNPNDLSQGVRPTIDIEPFYWPDRMRGFNKAIALNTGGIEFVEVPEGEVWKLLTFGFSLNTIYAPDQSYSASLGVERLPGQGLNGIEFASVDYQNLLATQSHAPSYFVQFPHPLILTEGQRVTVTCKRRTGSAFSGTMEGVYVLLQA